MLDKKYCGTAEDVHSMVERFPGNYFFVRFNAATQSLKTMPQWLETSRTRIFTEVGLIVVLVFGHEKQGIRKRVQKILAAQPGRYGLIFANPPKVKSRLERLKAESGYRLRRLRRRTGKLVFGAIIRKIQQIAILWANK